MKIHFYALAMLMTVVFITFMPEAHAQKGKVILAVFAHPDDEGTVTPVLIKYVAAGASIYVAIATDGRYGASAHFGVDDPDSLLAIRKEEIKCVTSKLGFNPPIMMGMHDQLKMQEGMDSMGGQLNTIRSNVVQLFTDLRPDVVITWGPSGLTGHPDHRMVGAVVTEVFSTKNWGKPARLYFTEVVTGSLPENSGLATVHSKYLNVKIPLSKAHIDKARDAWSCYKSQYTTEGADELQRLVWDTQKGVAYFRSFTSPQSQQRSLFPEVK